MIRGETQGCVQFDTNPPKRRALGPLIATGKPSRFTTSNVSICWTITDVDSTYIDTILCSSHETNGCQHGSFPHISAAAVDGPQLNTDNFGETVYIQICRHELRLGSQAFVIESTAAESRTQRASGWLHTVQLHFVSLLA